MEKLLRERKSFGPRVERAVATLKKLQSSDSAEVIDVATELDNLENIWVSYLSVYRKIVDACSTDEQYEEAVNHQLSVEEQYLALKAGFLKLQKRLDTTSSMHESTGSKVEGNAMNTLVQQQTEFLRLLSSNLTANNASSASASTAQHTGLGLPLAELRLPRMNLPIFSGNYMEWQSFYDLFKSAVDDNPSLKASQKFYFLKTNLAGEAATLVSHLNVEDANYAPALAKLKERYDRPREIANLHIGRFLNQPHLTSPSASGLRSLHDVSDEVIRALKALQREDRDIWLLHVLYEKLDQHTKELWCQKVADVADRDVTLDRFLKFLDSQSNALQTAQANRRLGSATNSASKVPPKVYTKGASAHVSTYQPPSVCGTCARPGHQPYQCGKFINASPHDRLSLICRQQLCQNCLKKHDGESCRSGSCRKCGLLHHTLLHNALQPAGNQTSEAEPSVRSSPAPQALISATSLANHLDGTNVLLLTAAIHVFDKYGRPHTVRAILDCASHISFIRKDLCNQLGIETSSIDLEFQGISATSSHSNLGVELTVASRCSDYRANIPCAVLDKISEDLPLRAVDVSNWPIPDSVHLADPQFHNPGKISVLLGLQPFLELMEPGRIELDKVRGLPVLQNTKLGWVVSGRFEEAPRCHSPVSTCLMTSTEDTLSHLMHKFFEIEEIVPPGKHLNEEEKLCESHFEQHTTRDDSGRFHVHLPFFESPEMLGASKDIAMKRLMHTERKLAKNTFLKEQYHDFLQDYFEAGHMSLAATPAPKGVVYLPHHCVVKDSSSTKCRVVFDASSKTANGKSLNDILMAGPVLQDPLIDILLRFRFPTIVLKGDIRQMYRMIWLAQDHRELLRILWRWVPGAPVLEFTLNTITYGTKSASYQATKCIQQLLQQFEESYPETVTKASKGIYMDDVLTGAETEEEARVLREQLTEIFSAGGFYLRKWATNAPSILEGVESEDIEMQLPVDLSDTCTIKALGILWQPALDEFQFRYKPISFPSNLPTKRSILSQIAGLFDPLGLLSPVVVKAKLVMQQLWQLKVDWDATPPAEVINEWDDIVNGFEVLDQIRIPRRVIGLPSIAKVFMHGYCDASARALGACVYIRVIDGIGNCSSNLLCAKSKVAPIGDKLITIPRLELQAAVLLSRLLKHVHTAVNYPIHEVRAFTDSQVVLAWLKGGAARWKTYVANRVAEVNNCLPSINWSHVTTLCNPADIVSRGATPFSLKDNLLWWHGPDWEEISNAEEVSELQNQQIERERRRLAVGLMVAYSNEFLDQMMKRYYPNLLFLQRVTARLRRFSRRGLDHLTSTELDEALMVYVRHTQLLHFAEDMERLRQGKEVAKGSPIHQLNPFLDPNEMLRVGGRLQKSCLNYETKHQLILPRNSILTSMLLQCEHIRNQHCGPQTLLAITRHRFWILCGASASRKAYRKCIICAKANTTPLYQQLGQLPADRVQPAPPFAVTGIDYAGPLNIVSRRARGAAVSRGYIAIFVCFTTKAVALEAVSDLTTPAFLAAFTRFWCRYGAPAKVYSDNATNFRAAAKQMKEIAALICSDQHNSAVADYMADKGIEWSFIPPRSPHHGGLWEAGVKVAKKILGKMSTTINYTFEELSTLLAQVAACMNSRPITPISSDPSDPEALTPAHFLIGRPLVVPPEVNQLERNINSLSRWQFIQRLAQDFRFRWQTEYVRSLQALAKWRRSAKNVEIGAVVLLIDDHDKSKQWPLGRILDVHPGSDGKVRVVTMKTRFGVVQRDVRRIRVIPLDEDEYAPGSLGA